MPMSVRDGVDCVGDRSRDLEGWRSPTPFKSLEPILGFAKVLIERLDVTPEPKLRPILKKRSKLSSNDSFFVKCTVNVLNQDLSKLKELCSKNPELLYTPAKSMKCNICNKQYESEKKLLKHHANKHVIIYKPETPKSQKRVTFSEKIVVHEVKEYHKCRKCPRIFESYVLLKAHMKKLHKKRKCYICNYCSTTFVDRMFFKVHIKLHCEACGQLFANKTSCNSHRRFECKTLKLHECKTCNAEFFHILDLKDHSYDHLETSVYVCNMCKEQHTIKCAVAHHIYFLHSKRRKKQVTFLYTKRKLGNESLYLCKFCDETSVDKDIIEAHVNNLPDLTNRAMIGYKDYYFCDQCTQKFETERELHSHKWTHFLKTPESQSEINEDKSSTKKEIKRFYKISEGIPDHFKPKITLDRIKIGGRELEEKDHIPFVNVNSFDVHNGNINKPIVSKSKKTLMSKHQCEICGRYFSSNYSLRRHIETLHHDLENLRCRVCEEVFVWPSLLQKHRCIRLQLPEMPFDDARPEIHFDNLAEMSNQYQSNTVTSTQEINGFDDLNITEDDNYMNAVDFEIPEPIVELSDSNRYVQSSVMSPSVSSAMNPNVSVSPNVGLIAQGVNQVQSASISPLRQVAQNVNINHSISPARLGINQTINGALPQSANIIQNNRLLAQQLGHLSPNVPNIAPMGMMSPNVSRMNQTPFHTSQITQTVNTFNDTMGKVTHFQTNGYKLVVQEVPIEF